MFKLIIADDERLIREALSTTINWKAYDIELVGVCRNGIEAYDMIQDEAPDIVLTDIRMPGMTGLDLIKQSSDAGLSIQFILLSGYSEFEYAKSAMRYGVKHYILKPYDDQQIIESICECKKDCLQMRLNQQLHNEQIAALSNTLHNVMSSTLNDCICQEKSLDIILSNYEPYLDFQFTSYQLLYVYYLEFDNFESFLFELKQYVESTMPNTILYGVYVNYTLLLFFKNTGENQHHLQTFIQQLDLANQPVALDTQLFIYSCLKDLLEEITPKLKRFGMIYYINNYHAIYTCNYDVVIAQIYELYSQILTGDTNCLNLLIEQLNSISNIAFFKQLSASLLLKVTSDYPSQSTFELTNWLLQIDKEENLVTLKELINGKLKEILRIGTETASYSFMTRQIFEYVNNNLSDSNLTLKHIAENYLYMNVDYVSKKFHKEAGRKFSQYLTETRIQRAKHIISIAPSTSVQSIALQVGCGNNPKYFSQIFKKLEGIPPSEYIINHAK